MAVFPEIKDLLPKQVEILYNLMQQVAQCEDEMPMDHWCKPCMDKYLRALELIHRWRKMGTYFQNGKWFCNTIPLPKYSTDTRYTFVCKDEDDKDPYTNFFNFGDK